MNNEQLVTKVILKKGFSEYSSFLPCLNFGLGLKGNPPQPATFHTTKRYSP
ncbi:MAG: hypothetical protein KA061_07745 [Bacteroidales bacterium]|nr:hypothetical protein [Bacteroidales bacterium]